MSWQQIEKMPCVLQVIETAEQEIKSLTGATVSLHLIAPNMAKMSIKKAQLQNLICVHFGVQWSNVVERKRSMNLVDARHAYMYFAHCVLKYTMQEVAEDCGCKNHSTVYHACQKVEGYIKVNDNWVKKIEEIRNIISA